MRVVIAFVQPFMVSAVIQAIHEVHGVTGASYGTVRGFGRGRSRDRAIKETLEGGTERMRVEVMINDDIEDAVVHAIQHAAHTGTDGDGKIYVVRLEQAHRIATGEEGPAAV